MVLDEERCSGSSIKIVGKPFSGGGRLVGLLFGKDGFFAEGDSEKKLITVRPFGQPCVIAKIPFETPYKQQLSLFEKGAPKLANAFVLGFPAPGYLEATTYDQIIQFYSIDKEDWKRAFKLTKENWVVGGYIPW